MGNSDSSTDRDENGGKHCCLWQCRRWVTRLGVLVMLAGMSVGCVPYQKYRDAEHKLYMNLEINRDLERQLREAEMRLARHGGDSEVTKISYDKLRGDYDQLLAEHQRCERDKAELIRQLNNLPELTIEGFTPQEATQIGAELGPSGELILEGDLLFASGKATLREESKRQLQKLSQVLQQRHSGRVVHVNGHTDLDPIEKSKWRDNWDLGMNRAYAVFGFLKQQGVPEENMRLYSAGFAEPAASASDPRSKEGKARCRRVEVYLGKTN